MIAALLIAKHKSGGVPGKNFMPLLGRPMVLYSILAAKHASRIDKVFVSTDSPAIKEIAEALGCAIIERPTELAQSESPTEHAYAHGYRTIKALHPELKIMALMFGNTPHVLAKELDRGILLLEENEAWDSVMSVAKYNMFSPMRARSISPDGTTGPTLNLDAMGLTNTFHRDAMGDIFYADFSVMIVRPDRCLEEPDAGALPFVWMGKTVGALEVPGGFDVDAPWQIAAQEFFLRENGFSHTRTPYDPPKDQD